MKVILILLLILFQLTLDINLYLGIALNISWVLLLIFLFKKELKLDYKNFNKSFIQFIIKYWAIISIFNFLFLSLVKNISENQEIVNNYTSSNLLLLLIPITILGPFIEEIIFRMSLKQIIKKDVVFIIISSLLFALAHTKFNINIHILNYGFMGFLLAYSYSKHKNIFVPIGVHILNNTMALLVPLLISLK